MFGITKLIDAHLRLEISPHTTWIFNLKQVLTAFAKSKLYIKMLKKSHLFKTFLNDLPSIIWIEKYYLKLNSIIQVSLGQVSGKAYDVEKEFIDFIQNFKS